MSKAEDRAFEKYPDYRGMDGGYITQRNKRMVYVEGYHQAEKDLRLTWEDIVEIDKLLIDLGMMFPVKSTPDYYDEVLKRFKDFKERKEK